MHASINTIGAAFHLQSTPLSTCLNNLLSVHWHIGGTDVQIISVHKYVFTEHIKNALGFFYHGRNHGSWWWNENRFCLYQVKTVIKPGMIFYFIWLFHYRQSCLWWIIMHSIAEIHLLWIVVNTHNISQEICKRFVLCFVWFGLRHQYRLAQRWPDVGTVVPGLGQFWANFHCCRGLLWLA